MLEFVRFEYQDPGALNLAGIPAFGHMQALVAEPLRAKVDTPSTAFSWTNVFPDVDADPNRMAALPFHLTQLSQWNGLAETANRGTYKIYYSPWHS